MYLNTAGLKRDSCHESYEEGVLNLRVICYLTQSVVKLSLWVSASLQLNLFLKSKISLKSVIVWRRTVVVACVEIICFSMLHVLLGKYNILTWK